MVDNETIAKLLKSIEDTNKKSIEEANQKQTQDIKQHIDNEIAQLKIKFEQDLKNKTEYLEAKYNELKESHNKIERELRKNNIIIFGLEATYDDLPNYIVDLLNRLLQISVSISDINNVYPIGKQTNKRPIIVKLTTYLKKQEILRNCRKLKGTPISISEELSFEERKDNKILREHLRQARSKNLNAVIKNRKLFINDQQYTVQQLLAEEEDVEDNEIVRENGDKHMEIIQHDAEAVALETWQQQTVKPNSAPSTPGQARKTQNKEIGKEEAFENFDTEKFNDSNKRKIVNVSEPVNKLRSSSRINCGDKTRLAPQSKTPKKI